MALIRQGSFEDMAATAAREVSGGGGPATSADALESFSTIGEMQEVAREAQPVKVRFPESEGDRGLAIDSFTLERGFEGFLGEVFGTRNEVFMVSWAWDFSGASPVVEPDPAEAAKYVHRLQAGERIEYAGDGRLLFPPRKVTGGMAVRIQICESDEGTRKAGETLELVRKAVEDSKLTSVLSLAALAGGPTTATLGLVKDAANELSQVIAAILKANNDDMVDLYEGYWRATGAWEPGREDVRGTASHLAFNRLD